MRRLLISGLILVGLLFAVPPARAAGGEQAAQAAAEAWLAKIDAGSYGESWKDASAYFEGAVKEDAWTASLDGARKPLGKLVSRKLDSAHASKELPGAPDGNYVVLQFDTSFENKKAAVETVTFVEEKDGQWKAAGYLIK